MGLPGLRPMCQRLVAAGGPGQSPQKLSVLAESSGCPSKALVPRLNLPSQGQLTDKPSSTLPRAPPAPPGTGGHSGLDKNHVCLSFWIEGLLAKGGHLHFRRFGKIFSP